MTTRILFSLVCVVLGTTSLLAQKGNLDPTFATQGLLTDFPYTTGISEVQVTQLYPLQDGRIYLAGKYGITENPGTTYCFLARLNSNGTYDPTFGPEGIGLVQVDSFTTEVSDLLFAPDSSVLLLERGGAWLAGFTKTGARSFAPQRVLNGAATVFSPTLFIPYEGSMLLLVQENIDGTFALQARDYSDGSLMTNFGTNGVWTITSWPALNGTVQAVKHIVGTSAAYSQKLMMALEVQQTDGSIVTDLVQLIASLSGTGELSLNWNNYFRTIAYYDSIGNELFESFPYEVYSGFLDKLMVHLPSNSSSVYSVIYNPGGGSTVYATGDYNQVTYIPSPPSFAPVNTQILGMQNGYQPFILPSANDIAFVEGIAPSRFTTFPPASFYFSRVFQVYNAATMMPVAVLDSTIGTDGHLTLCADDYWNQPLAVARQHDGKILVGGIRIDSLDNKTLFVARVDLGLNTALSPVQAPEIRVSPNPARDRVAIESALPVLRTSLINLQGQVVKTFAKNQAIDIQGIVSGLYLLKVETTAGMQTVKLAID